MADDSFSPEIISRKDAIAAGRRFFFNGKPCRRGHITVRPVSNGDCPTCRDDRVKAWNEANAGRRKAIRDKWRVDNLEKDKQTKMEYAARNREKIAADSKAYYRANKVQHRASTRAWKDAHPAECVVSAHACRARKFGWTGLTITVEQYNRIVSDQAGRCAYCRRDGEKMVFEHVQPVIYGGSFAATNCVLACRKCNTGKSFHPLPFFLERLAKRHPELNVATPLEIEAMLAADWRKG